MARILIVDDAPIMRKNLKTILTEAGHTVIAEASNGSQAYIEYVKHKPDLVTMDITMPFMNGLDTLKKIINDFPNAIVIIISSTNNNKVILEAIQSGAKNYIIKPFMVDKVLEVVNQVLEVNNKITSETIDRIYKNMEHNDPDIYTFCSDITNTNIAMHQNTSIDDYLGESSFAVKLKNNTFFVNIDDKIEASSFEVLYNGMQGFLMVKPLRIVFDFNLTRTLYNGYTDKIIEFSNKVIDIGGSVAMVISEKLLITAFKNRGISDNVKFFSSLSDIV